MLLHQDTATQTQRQRDGETETETEERQSREAREARGAAWQCAEDGAQIETTEIYIDIQTHRGTEHTSTPQRPHPTQTAFAPAPRSFAPTLFWGFIFD
jgi:hypothetical protein